MKTVQKDEITAPSGPSIDPYAPEHAAWQEGYVGGQVCPEDEEGDDG